MKTFYNILRILMGSCVGVFLGSSIYRYYDYKTYPELYEMNSAPWYLSIEVNAVYTLISVVLIFIVMQVLKRKRKE
ncbi:MAG: hypothetical protein HFG41_05110 [Coprococcus sp.]|nr:hypothetical protein [Coprococcus sp.]